MQQETYQSTGYSVHNPQTGLSIFWDLDQLMDKNVSQCTTGSHMQELQAKNYLSVLISVYCLFIA